LQTICVILILFLNDALGKSGKKRERTSFQDPLESPAPSSTPTSIIDVTKGIVLMFTEHGRIVYTFYLQLSS